MISKREQAEFLAEAMPYIKKYNDKILVIKYGGNAMINEELKTSVMRDLVLLQLVGIKVVLVHGGGPEISEMLKRVGIESRFVNGLRYTDAETAEIVRMVLAGKINKALVNQLETCGGKAVGLSGIDGHMLGCEKESEELGFVGKIEDVDIRIIEDCLKSGYIPVVSTVGYDNFGNVYHTTVRPNSYLELAKEELKLVGFRYAPYDLKRYCETREIYFDALQAQRLESLQRTIWPSKKPC